MPGETDFRVFNEVGQIPGFDFVLYDYGYLYVKSVATSFLFCANCSGMETGIISA